MIKYNCNVCDRIYNEVIIHFTKKCPNNCPFCIDKKNVGVNSNKPNIMAIWNSLKQYASNITDVTISGGEPFLYIKELYDLIKLIKNFTNLKISIVTSFPYQCTQEENKEIFNKICEAVDSIQISGGHFKKSKLEKLFGNKNISNYNRDYYLKCFPYKDKTILSINTVKDIVDTKEDILDCIKYFNEIGYKNIKIAEMFDADKYYVDISKILGIKMKSPFSHGCKTTYNLNEILPECTGTLTIKRTCFLRTNCQKASFSDCFKMLTRYILKKEYFFGVIHEDGTIAPYWI